MTIGQLRAERIERRLRGAQRLLAPANRFLARADQFCDSIEHGLRLVQGRFKRSEVVFQ